MNTAEINKSIESLIAEGAPIVSLDVVDDHETLSVFAATGSYNEDRERIELDGPSFEIWNDLCGYELDEERLPVQSTLDAALDAVTGLGRLVQRELEAHGYTEIEGGDADHIGTWEKA